MGSYGDDWLSDCLVIYIESVNNKKILQHFQHIKSPTEQLSIKEKK